MKKRLVSCGITALVAAAIAAVVITACTDPTNPFLDKLFGSDDAHIHVWSAWTVTMASTCIATGIETRTCTLDAAHTETRGIAINPNAHLWGEWIQTRSPTETENGEKKRTCAHDPTHIDTDAINALGHTHVWGEWMVTTPATCIATGIETITCTLNPAHIETQTIAVNPNAHDWGGWVEIMAPTATKNGTGTRTCNRDANHNEGKIIPATGIKADPIVTWPQGLTATYGQTLADISLVSYTNNGTGTFAWTTPGDSVGGLGTRSHSMTFTPTDTADYNTLTQNVVITVNAAHIIAAAVTITGPTKGSTPVTTALADGTSYTCGAVSWNPNDNPFKGGTVYTATVRLTANSGYTFTNLSDATVNGQNANISNNTGAAVTLSYTFLETDTRTATGITLKTQPTKLTYTHGDPLDLTGLVVTLTYDDTTTEDVAAAGFAAKNITVNPAHGTHLIHVTHSGQPVTITYGDLTPLTTGNLTVNKAPGAFAAHVTINTTYTPALTLASLNSHLQSGYAWVTSSTSLSAGNGQSFAAIYIDPSGNYESATGAITVNVAKATGSFAAHAAINTTYTPTLTLAALNAQLQNGYVWVTPSSSLSAGNGQSFYATYTDPSGNYESATGAITVNVAKAAGIFAAHAAINTTYTTTLTLAALNVHLSIGYAWTSPSTSLNAGNNQPFAATYTDPSGNYETATGTITVNVAKAAGTFAAHAAIHTTYAPTLTLAGLNAQLQNGYAWVTPSTTLNAGNNQPFAATYTDPSGNYEAATGAITVNVAKATGAAVNAPALNARTHNSITIDPVTASTGQTVEYAINSTNAAPSTGWQTGTTFGSLSIGTTYYIFARAAGNSNYETGTVSGSLTVTTLQTVSPDRIEYYWVDQHGSLITTSGGATTVAAGATLTITPQGVGYVVQQWHLNGKNTGQSGNTYNFSSTTAGKHTVSLFVEKDGKLYNTNITITVQ
jgi:hypothetical protein